MMKSSNIIITILILLSCILPILSKSNPINDQQPRAMEHKRRSHDHNSHSSSSILNEIITSTSTFTLPFSQTGSGNPATQSSFSNGQGNQLILPSSTLNTLTIVSSSTSIPQLTSLSQLGSSSSSSSTIKMPILYIIGIFLITSFIIL